MPKEITYSNSDPVFLKTADGHEYAEGSPEATQAVKDQYSQPGPGPKWRQRGVHVGWTRGNFVEVGVASFDVSKEQPADGAFIHLDRDAINRVIRSLRKARDAAYGADA